MADTNVYAVYAMTKLVGDFSSLRAAEIWCLRAELATEEPGFTPSCCDDTIILNKNIIIFAEKASSKVEKVLLKEK